MRDHRVHTAVRVKEQIASVTVIGMLYTVKKREHPVRCSIVLYPRPMMSLLSTPTTTTVIFSSVLARSERAIAGEYVTVPLSVDVPSNVVPANTRTMVLA